MAAKGMNAAFLNALGPHLRHPSLTHKQVVTRLYRRSLKLMMSYAVNTDLIVEEAGRIRAEFEKHRNLPTESGKAKRLIREALTRLADMEHPDKYTIPYMPGGSKFMRNSPPPLEVVFPHGVPEDVLHDTVLLHPDSVPLTFRPEVGPAPVVDPMRKEFVARLHDE